MKLELMLSFLMMGCSQSFKSIYNETRECASDYIPEKTSIPFDSLNFRTIPDSLIFSSII